VNRKLNEAGAAGLKEEAITHEYPSLLALQETGHFQGHGTVVHLHGKNGAPETALEEITEVNWIPHWGRDRIYGLIENRPDWCISRQRAWGVPITLFYCEVRKGHPDPGDHGSCHQACGTLRRRHLVHGARKISSPGTRCEKCGGSKFTKGERYP
jgi:isoleucyl-tRNA synthetase